LRRENPIASSSIPAPTLHQLSKRLHETSDPKDRLELLTQMRLLLGDADKIIGSEMGEY